MKSVEFCYWLQGFFELVGADENTTLSPVQTTSIRNHLALVFRHEIDPSYSADPKVQADMQVIHDGGTPSSKPPRPPRHDPPSGLAGGKVLRC